MESSVSEHPPDETLVAHGSGKLDESVATSIKRHLKQCGECRHRVTELASVRPVGRPKKTQPQADTVAARPNTVAEPCPPRPSSAAETPNAIPPLPSGPLPPELVNHPQYEVIRELGRGGMGVVYLARNKPMNRLEVLKVLQKEILKRQGSVDRFMQEIQSAAQLNDPNVVAAYAVLQLGDLIVFAMEHVEGHDLGHLVRERGPLPMVNACYFIYQAAQGLQHAHERGMIHRDIKPDNLILYREGKRATVKILDFGLAKMSSEGAADASLTVDDQMLGTPDYVAPEQTRDAKSADIRADIYSLGCTLYHLLAGKPPFRGSSLFEILEAHKWVEAKPLNQLRSDVPEALAAIVAKMMAKDPKLRYQQPSEVAQSLKPFFKPESGAPAVAEQPAPKVERQSVNAEENEASSAPKAGASQRATPDLVQPTGASPKGPAATIEIDRSSLRVDVPKSPVEPEKRRPAWIWPAAAAGAVLAGVIAAWALGLFKGRANENVSDRGDDPQQVSVDDPERTPPSRPPVLLALSAPPDRQNTGWTKLFNGTNFDGWFIDGGGSDTWMVEQGAIVSRWHSMEPRTYLRSNREYSDFVLRLDFQLEANASINVALRSLPKQGMAPNQSPTMLFDHPALKMGNNALGLKVGTVWGPKSAPTIWVGNDSANTRELKQRPAGTWNQLEIEVKGRALRAWVNGDLVKNTSSNPSELPLNRDVAAVDRPKGRIGFQSQSGTARFRNIEIQELVAETHPDSTAPTSPPAEMSQLGAPKKPAHKPSKGNDPPPSLSEQRQNNDSVQLRPDTSQVLVGQRLAFLVGVKKYDHGSLHDLTFAENDVTVLAEVLKAQRFQVVLLTTELAKKDKSLEPSAENIRKRLEELLKMRKVTKHDLIVVGLAGHGIQPLGSSEAFYCPRDANPTIEEGRVTRPETLVALTDLLKQMDQSGIGHKLLLVDTCPNDPSVPGKRGVVRVDVSALPPQTGVLLSCAQGEFSFEHKELGTGHGVFFYHVIEGLRGAAHDADDGTITWEGLGAYVRKRVPATVKRLFGKNGGEQEPNGIGNLFEPSVLAMVRIEPHPQTKQSTPLKQTPDDSPGTPETKSDSSAGFFSLFNGKDLDGWTVDGVDPDTWKVEQGEIVGHAATARAILGASYEPSTYLFTNREYSDFVLRLEFNLEQSEEPGRGRCTAVSGIALRARKGEKLSINRQSGSMNGGRSGGVASGRAASILDHPLFKLIDDPGAEQTGTTHWMRNFAYAHPDQSAELHPAGSWNRLEIEVKARTMIASVNGKRIVNMTLPAGALLSDRTVPGLGRTKGLIGLQRDAGTVRFRNIEVMELAKSRNAIAKLPEGSVWRGERTFNKGSRSGQTVQYELYIEERQGAKFKGHASVGSYNDRVEVEGHLDGNAVIWRERRSRGGTGGFRIYGGINTGSDWSIKGVLNGDVIRFKFTAPSQRSRTGSAKDEGDGELKRDQS
jgi:serine/threonine protein kinase